MTTKSLLEQKLRMMIIDDNVFQVDKVLVEEKNKYFPFKDKYYTSKINPNQWGEKYVGLQERYEDIFTIDRALTFQDGGIPRDYWAKFKLRDTKYDLIVLDQKFPGQIQHGREILGEIRKIRGGYCPLNARTFVLGYSAHLAEDRKKRSWDVLAEEGWNAIVSGRNLPEDLFIEVDKYLAEKHPEQLVKIRVP